MRTWIEVALSVPAAAADAMTGRLIDGGAPGVIEEYAGERVRLRAHFPEPAAESSLLDGIRQDLARLDEFFPGSAATALEVARVAEEDWAEGWKRNFPPIEIGRTLRIRSPWSAKVDDGRLDVEIRPAMAFGTGQHASTRGCLLALEESMAERLSPVLDVGTGSGILAIAAARLGAREVLAIDDDPAAVEAARENVARNGLEDVIAVRAGGLEMVHGDFALIVANLFSDALRASFALSAARAARPARLIVSGFLDPDAGALSGSAAASGWREVGRRSLEGWTALVFRKD